MWRSRFKEKIMVSILRLSRPEIGSRLYHHQPGDFTFTLRHQIITLVVVFSTDAFSTFFRRQGAGDG
jgi:hypothetical protein